MSRRNKLNHFPIGNAPSSGTAQQNTGPLEAGQRKFNAAKSFQDQQKHTSNGGHSSSQPPVRAKSSTRAKHLKPQNRSQSPFNSLPQNITNKVNDYNKYFIMTQQANNTAELLKLQQ